jgi:ribosome biogenesis protein Tsr3
MYGTADLFIIYLILKPLINYHNHIFNLRRIDAMAASLVIISYKEEIRLVL